MYVELFVLLVAKYAPPIALVVFILSRLFYLPDANTFIGTFLFFGWWAAYEVCSAYEKYEKKKYGDK